MALCVSVTGERLQTGFPFRLDKHLKPQSVNFALHLLSQIWKYRIFSFLRESSVRVVPLYVLRSKLNKYDSVRLRVIPLRKEHCNIISFVSVKITSTDLYHFVPSTNVRALDLFPFISNIFVKGYMYCLR